MNRQIYYHFLSSKHAIDDLENKWINISLIEELNDPFELLPYLRYKEVEKRKLYHNIRREVSKNYGLLCFSRTWNEPLLWGHYADKHKGIAIGFEVLEDEVFEVKYSPEPKRTKFELTENQKENEKLFLDLAKTKYEKWSYEEEHRILVKIKDCKPVCIGGRKYSFLKFRGRLQVKEIVLGCKFDYKQEQSRMSILAEKLNAKIVLTREGWEDYKIHQCGTKTKKFGIFQ
ncbi:DUF2971 domain-containing protein [Candidatus Parcubacteria bacterium]|nr:DUF2971 domain-containing protein [Candidatus Parcubacteria bacterium]